MTESTGLGPAQEAPHADVPHAAAPHHDLHPARTGNQEVDAVLDTLHGLGDAPLSEHVAVFEAAHDRLRAALADAGRESR